MRIVAPAVLAALVALAPVATAQVAPRAAPAVPAPSTATVPATGGWTRTGVTVRSGGRLELRAQGQWSTGGSSLTAAPAPAGADGFAGRRDPRALLPGANVGALIGKIGDKGTPFLVGAAYTGAAAADGELFLAFNDDPRAAGDNTGRLSVAVTARAPLQVTRLPSAVVAPPTRTPPTLTRPPTGVVVTPPTTPPPPGAQPGAAPPSTTTPPTRPPGTDATPAPPSTSPPNRPTPPPRPAPQPPPAAEPTVPAPPAIQDSPPPVAQEPVLPEPESAPTQDIAPAPAPPAEPIAPPQQPGWLLPALLAGAAVLVLLALLVLRGGRKSGPDSQSPIGAPRVSARLATDGRVGETLSVTWRGRA